MEHSKRVNMITCEHEDDSVNMRMTLEREDDELTWNDV